MDIYALPTELLDRRELELRYKEIDAAVVKARANIALTLPPKHQRKLVRLTLAVD